MSTLETALLRRLALNKLTRDAGSAADARSLAAAAHRAYDDLARALVPLIGEAGVSSLAARAWHLAQRDSPSLAHTRDSAQTSEPFAQLQLSLERNDDPAVVAEAAAVALASLLALLVTFIGEPLTMNLLRRAWPDGSSDPSTGEKRP
jgi:hypothetical protein